MALPKKKTSKSRSKRRFSQYCYNRKRKLESMADSLKQIDKPFIYDSSIVESSATAKTKKEEVKTDVSKKEVSKKPSLKKVDEIKVDKKATGSTTDKGTEGSTPTGGQKDKWFSNLFQSKGKTGGSNPIKKKNFRRKSM